MRSESEVKFIKISVYTHLKESSVSLLTVLFLSCIALNHSIHNARFSTSEPKSKNKRLKQDDLSKRTNCYDLQDIYVASKIRSQVRSVFNLG